MEDLLLSNYRRAKFPGGYYFFTVLTHKRRKIFVDSVAREQLRNAWQRVCCDHPFDVIALCLLPEHIHCIWQLPGGDADFSIRWRLVKTYFTRAYLATNNETRQSNSRTQRGERGIWQRRFWEHQIRDENDLNNHIDYIHYNPVKHSLVQSVDDWPHSTYHKFVKSGFYRHRVLNDYDGNFGEDFTG